MNADIKVIMNENIKFGQFISDLRIRHSMRNQELAEKLGISNAYLSQLEHGVRLNPDADIVMKIAIAHDLTKQETATLFDMYAEATGQLSPDIVEYIKNNKWVQKALRYAHDVDAADDVWERFIEQLKNEQ